METKNGWTALFLVSIISLSLLGTVVISCTQQPEKKYVVGIVNPNDSFEKIVTGFKEGMEERGYHEGKNIKYLYDGPLDNMGKADETINAMIAANVDLLYCITTPVTKKVKSALAGTKIPAVFGPVFDPVSGGIVESLARPGGLVTGVKVRGSSSKALEWFLSFVPGARRIFIPFHVTDTAAAGTVQDLEESAANFNIEFVKEEFTTVEELEKVLMRIPEDIDAIWLTSSHIIVGNIPKIVRAAVARNIPVAASISRIEEGILVSYGANHKLLSKQVARLADKLLKGASPATTPVETAEFYLGINMKTARNLGIRISDADLKKADYIFR